LIAKKSTESGGWILRKASFSRLDFGPLLLSIRQFSPPGRMILVSQRVSGQDQERIASGGVWRAEGDDDCGCGGFSLD
jgi:hypothetical protein